MPLVKAVLIRRYKRFLADVCLVDSGEKITVYCPNTGAMTGCAEPGCVVWLSVSTNKKRKYLYTWELTVLPSGDNICIHSAFANTVVVNALNEACLPEFSAYTRFRREVTVDADLAEGKSSRIDFLLESDLRKQRCYLEVKSVTLHYGNGLGVFPDTVSVRASKHLRELINLKKTGEQAALLLCVFNTAIDRVAPADAIDPEYGRYLREAISQGVLVLAYACEISQAQIRISHRLPVLSEQPSTTKSEI